MNKLNNSYLWADWYVGHYQLRINSENAFKHFKEEGFKAGLNPNPLISLWWMQESMGVNYFDDFIFCLKNRIRSHPYFDVELFPGKNDVWKYYCNTAKEKKLNPCSGLSFLELISLRGLQNKHLINILLILGEEYRNYIIKNQLQESEITRANFITLF